MKGFETYHPIVIFYYFSSVMCMTMFFMHPVYIGSTFLVATILRMMWLRGQFWKSSWYYIPLLLVMAVVNPLISHNGKLVILYINDNPITIEAIVYGFAIALMVVAIMFWFSCYNIAMTSDKFLYLFGKVSPILALTISITMRLIPSFKHQLRVISDAQKTIGMDFTVGSPLHRVKSCMKILSILITWALENAIETADSMKARGYGVKKRTTFSLFVIEIRDIKMISYITLLIAVCLYGVFTGYMTYYYYPTFTTLYWSIDHLLFYFIYLILLSIPIMMNVKEDIKWRYLQSKI
nr:energy-coupling factor transporter transmembrane component T [Lysinibacillus timonensis]